MKKIVYLFILLTIFLLLSGCNSTRTYQDEKNFTDNWGKQFSEINNYKQYEPLIQQGIDYFQAQNKTPYSNKEFLKASWLKMSYLELFVIYEQEGYRDKANIAFEKAKYWGLIRQEYSLIDYNAKNINDYLKQFNKEFGRMIIAKLLPELFKNKADLEKALKYKPHVIEDKEPVSLLK